MEILTAGEIAGATQGTLVTGTCDRRSEGVSTDSRTIEPGQLFVPLIGERFDGHEHVTQALKRGAAGFLFATRTGDETATVDPIDRLREMGIPADELPSGPDRHGSFAIAVPDTLVALQDLARYYRGLFRIPAVGITGSVGKTSTKDIIASVLRERFRTVATVANFNNEIGLPLTIFGLDRSSEALVAEMGMRGLGQIEELVRIAQPNVGVVTNVGETHLELLGSKENIAKAKGELIAGLPPSGTAVLNGDDPLVSAMDRLCHGRVVKYGISAGQRGLDCRGSHIESFGVKGIRFRVEAQGLRFPVELPIPGIHNVHNALAAVTVGLVLGLSEDEIRAGLSKVKLSAMRLSVRETPEGWLIINDAYNASPASVHAALRILVESREAGRAVAVLGDMLELGEVSEGAHHAVGREAGALGIDVLVGVGPLSAHTVAGAREGGIRDVWAFDDNLSAAQALPGILREGDVVLVKGSRGMRMELIARTLTKEEVTDHA